MPYLSRQFNNLVHTDKYTGNPKPVVMIDASRLFDVEGKPRDRNIVIKEIMKEKKDSKETYGLWHSFITGLYGRVKIKE